MRPESLHDLRLGDVVLSAVEQSQAEVTEGTLAEFRVGLCRGLDVQDGRLLDQRADDVSLPAFSQTLAQPLVNSLTLIRRRPAGGDWVAARRQLMENRDVEVAEDT